MTDKPTKEELIQALGTLEKMGVDVTRLFSEEEDEKDDHYDEAYVKGLQSTLTLFSDTHEFEIGQVVKWKEGMRNKRLPKRNQPAIVVQVLESPLIDEENVAGSPYFREPLDIVIGVLGKEGEFLTFYHDSRRFEPYL